MCGAILIINNSYAPTGRNYIRLYNKIICSKEYICDTKYIGLKKKH